MISQPAVNIPEIINQLDNSSGSLQSSLMSEVNTHGDASCFALG